MIFLENYIKTVLYAYPLLKTVEEDYAEHIRNKALLSYDSRYGAERLTEYLAEEILLKNRLLWLRTAVEKVMDRLSDVERALVAVRYFGKQRQAKILPLQRNGEKEGWSERTYFRKQQRLGEKVGAMLRVSGVTKEVFDEEFSDVDIFRKIHRFVEEGRDRKIAADETRWLAKGGSTAGLNRAAK